MKIYPKTFESVFSEDTRKKFDFSQVSTKDIEINKYIKDFRGLLIDFSYNLFDFYVKVTWLKKKFCYQNKQISINGNTGGNVDYVFTRFLRRIIGRDIQFLTRDFLYTKVISYFKDFFPDFDDGNPFENTEFYKFPFKNITIEYLVVVYQMEDRIELLKYADEQKMTYATFLDFVINQIYSINEELGRDKYLFIITRRHQNYIKDTDKKLISIKKVRRKTKR